MHLLRNTVITAVCLCAPFFATAFAQDGVYDTSRELAEDKFQEESPVYVPGKSKKAEEGDTQSTGKARNSKVDGQGKKGVDDVTGIRKLVDDLLQEDALKREEAAKAEEQASANAKEKDTAIYRVPDTLTLKPLNASYFSIGGVRPGATLQRVKNVFGSPTKYSQSDHYTELKYNRQDLNIRFVLRNDTAQILKTPDVDRKPVKTGVEQIFLSKGDDVFIGPGIHLGHPAELLIRKYGIPFNILRDADANVYYFVYESPKKDHLLIFAIVERKVARVALISPRPPYTDGLGVTKPQDRSERDFTLVGYGVNEPFQANRYNMWTNLIKKKDRNFWLYGSYGVEVSRHNEVTKVFLLNNSSYTSRGATLGYNLSTVLALYGMPDRIEKGPEGDQYVDAYYYDSPYQKNVSLVFIVKRPSAYIDDVLLITEPIKNIQGPLERYGLK